MATINQAMTAAAPSPVAPSPAIPTASELREQRRLEQSAAAALERVLELRPHLRNISPELQRFAAEQLEPSPPQG